MRVAQIGEAGQRRIAAARVDVRLEGLAALVAARYLAGAGVDRVRVSTPDLAREVRAVDASISVEVDEHLAPDGIDEPGADDPQARAALRGARVALRSLVHALEAKE